MPKNNTSVKELVKEFDDFSVELLEEGFPKGLSKERGVALVYRAKLLIEFEKILFHLQEQTRRDVMSQSHPGRALYQQGYKDGRRESEHEINMMKADMAHAIGYCRGLGHPETYLEKRYPELTGEVEEIMQAEGSLDSQESEDGNEV